MTEVQFEEIDNFYEEYLKWGVWASNLISRPQQESKNVDYDTDFSK